MYDPRDPDGYAQADYAGEMRDLARSERNGEDAERAAEVEREHDEKLDVEMGEGTEDFMLVPGVHLVAGVGKRFVVVEQLNTAWGTFDRVVVHADRVADLHRLLGQVLDGALPEPMRYLTAEDSDEPF